MRIGSFLKKTSEIKRLGAGGGGIDKNEMILFDFGITRYIYFILFLKKLQHV